MKNVYKLLTVFFLSIALMFGNATVMSAKSFSGSRSSSHSFSSGSTHSGSFSRSYSGSGSRSSGSYNSGYKRPSSNVTGSNSIFGSSYSQPRRSGFGSFFGGFATGMVTSSLFGSLFHPFGGYYGVGYHGFSFFGLIFDLFLIWLIVKIIKGIFFRR